MDLWKISNNALSNTAEMFNYNVIIKLHLKNNSISRIKYEIFEWIFNGNYINFFVMER
jgi:hypothetical protein